MTPNKQRKTEKYPAQFLREHHQAEDSTAYLLPKDEELGKSSRFYVNLVLAESWGQWRAASESQPLSAKAFRPDAPPDIPAWSAQPCG